MSAVETGKLYHGLSSAGGGEFHLLGGLFDEGLEAGATAGLIKAGCTNDD